MWGGGLLSAIGSGTMGVADMAWNMKVREEDLGFRDVEVSWHAEEVFRRAVEDRRRAVDEKAKQLEQIASQGALMAGFAMVALTQMSIPATGVSHTLLVIFGLTVSLLIGLMTIVMLNATFMLVAIMKYDTNARDPAYPSFQTFWDSRCEGDWRRSFQAFNFGMPLFLAMNSEVSWIIFNDYGMAAPIIVSIVCTVFFVIYALTTYRKWAAYLGSLRRSDAGVDGGDGGHGHNLAGGNGNGAGVSGVNGSGMRPSYHGGMPGAAWGSPSPQAAAGEPAWGPVGTSMPPRGSAPAAGATGGSDGSGGIDPRQESSHWA